MSISQENQTVTNAKHALLKGETKSKESLFSTCFLKTAQLTTSIRGVDSLWNHKPGPYTFFSAHLTFHDGMMLKFWKT